jgi:hypothetical protein
VMLTSDTFESIEFLSSAPERDLKSFRKQPIWPSFSGDLVEFLDLLSKELMENQNLREFPDVAAFAFFCRKANINSLCSPSKQNLLAVGRGIVFHLAPSNVPINFAFSWLMGFVTGNLNIVRLPSKNYRQINIVLEAISQVSKKNKQGFIEDRSLFIRYDKNSNATREISLISDIRMIWGGDAKISDVRRHPIPAKAYDIPFADRYSICALSSKEIAKSPDLQSLAKAFFNDTFLSDQNACTSPHLIFWVGKKAESLDARISFWREVQKLLEKKSEIETSVGLDKLHTFCLQSDKFNVKRLEPKNSNNLWLVELIQLEKGIEEIRSHSGYFLEFFTEDLSDMGQVVNSKYQTLSYFGFNRSDLKNLILKLSLDGIDRVVKVGHAQEFSPQWDGYDLTEMLTRKIDIR